MMSKQYLGSLEIIVIEYVNDQKLWRDLVKEAKA